MVFWLRNKWKKPNMCPPRDRRLIYDAHRAQTTEGKDNSDARVPDDIGACTSRRNEQGSTTRCYI